jgi:hypothetical protein
MAAEQAKPRGVGRVSEDDLPYAGVLGRTRSEAVQVLMPDGSLRSLSVYVGIDAVADPALAALARAGTLHHVAEGVELALPFVYHDPVARIFLLVLPESLRHRALALRAEIMLGLASEPQHPVPDYARDVELVVGAHGLVARLEDGSRKLVLVDADAAQVASARALARRERELLRRERLIEARERAMRLPGPVLAAIHESDIEELDDQSDDELYEAEELEGIEADEDGDSGEADDASELEEVEDLEDEAYVDEETETFSDASDVIAVYDPSLLSPEGLAFEQGSQLWLTEGSGAAWLFVRGRPGSRRQDAEMELLVQLDPTLEVPVVLVSLVFDVDGSPEVRRGVVDPFAPAQLRALYLLAQYFEVQLVAVSAHGNEHFATLHTPREGNVRAILAQLERLGELDRDRWERARDAALASPPPWRDLTHPFQSELASDAPLTATEAAVLLDELGDWLSPERQARVRLALCVPDEVVDARYRTGIGHALDWGLSLSRELAARALELGIEKDEGALLRRRIEGLCRTSRETDFGGLEQGVLRAEWSDALEQAARLGVSLTDDARELAQRHAGERALVHATALSDTRDASLDPARERARQEPPEREALEELLAHGGYRDVLEACRLSHKLTPEVVGGLFARVARRVDPVALDALLTLLSFPEPLLVRAGAALALASRRALNALDDLVAHVAREDEAAFPVFALALGRYGAGSFRAIARAMKKHDVDPERAALVYAHLALHGARAQVRARARGRDPRDAQLAERALALASELKDGKKPALALEQQGSLTVFCEMFDRLCRDTVG